MRIWVVWSNSSVIGTEELWSWVHYNPNKNFAGNVFFFLHLQKYPSISNLCVKSKHNTICLFFSLLHCKLMFTLFCRKLKENNGTVIKIWQNFLRMNNIDRTKRVSSDFRRLKLSSGTCLHPLRYAKHHQSWNWASTTYAPGSLIKPQISWTY